MDNTQPRQDAQLGTREKCIYALTTFVNQDGFKVEKHVPVEGSEADKSFYGFYLVNTEMGPIDRYFKFKNETTVEECFDSFKEMAEADAKNLAAAMEREAQRMDREEQGTPPPEAKSAPHTTPARAEEPPQGSQLPVDGDTEVLDKEGLPI